MTTAEWFPMSLPVAIVLGWAIGIIAAPLVSDWQVRQRDIRWAAGEIRRAELRRKAEEDEWISRGAVGFDTKAKKFIMRDGSQRPPLPGSIMLAFYP